MSKTEINAIDDSLAIALLRKLLKQIDSKEDSSERLFASRRNTNTGVRQR